MFIQSRVKQWDEIHLAAVRRGSLWNMATLGTIEKKKGKKTRVRVNGLRRQINACLLAVFRSPVAHFIVSCRIRLAVFCVESSDGLLRRVLRRSSALNPPTVSCVESSSLQSPRQAQHGPIDLHAVSVGRRRTVRPLRQPVRRGRSGQTE